MEKVSCSSQGHRFNEKCRTYFCIGVLLQEVRSTRVPNAKGCYKDRLIVAEHSGSNVPRGAIEIKWPLKHLGGFLDQMRAVERPHQREWARWVLIPREGRKSLSRWWRWIQGQRRRMGSWRVCRERSSIVLCVFWWNDDVLISVPGGAEVMVAGVGSWRPKLWCWGGSRIGSRSDSTRDLRIKVLPCHCLSFKIEIDRVEHAATDDQFYTS